MAASNHIPNSTSAAEPTAAERTHLRRVGLRYVSDSVPGYYRKRRGRGFAYVDAEGKKVDDPNVLERIGSLVIPPAYEDVWICPIPHGHLQATGRDAAGRKQYRYHPSYVKLRSEKKYGHLTRFAQCLPRLRRAVDEDLQRSSFDRERMLAAAVRLLDVTLIRVGNREYALRYDTFGITTLRCTHVDVHGGTIDFHFIGKRGIQVDTKLEDPRLARLIRKCRELPGQELFSYRDESGAVHAIGSGDVNEYLHQNCGEEFTAKYFRTWGGTVLAAITLGRMDPPTSESRANKDVVVAVKTVAKELGNRPATCRKYYIHPVVLEAHREGRLQAFMNHHPRPDRPVPRRGLSAEEKAVLNLLQDAGAD